ncbi:MAG: hypothetical protein J0L60_12750 [Ignavibacteria bacterium]|nr:hypothetical protein [Ignavibacteria bacterium]
MGQTIKSQVPNGIPFGKNFAQNSFWNISEPDDSQIDWEKLLSHAIHNIWEAEGGSGGMYPGTVRMNRDSNYTTVISDQLGSYVKTKLSERWLTDTTCTKTRQEITLVEGPFIYQERDYNFTNLPGLPNSMLIQYLAQFKLKGGGRPDSNITVCSLRVNLNLTDISGKTTTVTLAGKEVKWDDLSDEFFTLIILPYDLRIISSFNNSSSGTIDPQSIKSMNISYAVVLPEGISTVNHGELYIDNIEVMDELIWYVYGRDKDRIPERFSLKNSQMLSKTDSNIKTRYLNKKDEIAEKGHSGRTPHSGSGRAVVPTIRYVKAGNPTPVYPYTTWATASDSIQKVVDMCESRDTILIGTGVYREQVVSEHQGRDLAIIGIDVDSCIVDLSGFPQFSEIYAFFMRDNITLENLTFRTKKATTYHSGLYISWPAGITKVRIRNNLFLGNFRYALSVWSGTGEASMNLFTGAETAIETAYQTSAPPIEIRSNIMYKNIYTLSLSTGLISENLILYNDWKAIALGLFGGTARFYNNLISFGGNASTGVGLGRGFFANNIFRLFTNVVEPWTAYSPINFINNTVDSCGVVFDLYRENVVAGSINYNNFYGNGTISNDISKLNPDTLIYTSYDPMYEGTDSSNYRLQMYSPLIDAGDPTILDVDGTRSDIGRYGGPYGQRYEYLDLAPKKPSFTLVTSPPLPSRGDASGTLLKGEGRMEIHWRGGTEADFNSFSLHRGRDPYFIPGELNRIYTGRDTMFTDSISDPTGNYTYKITARDNQGLVSKWDSVTVVLTDIAEGGELSPKGVVLYQNYPNPFNPSTTIRFRLEEPGEVILRVYDVNGSTVAVLNNGWLPAGEHERDFTPGKTGTMNDMASGVYFYNLTVRDANLKPVFIRSDKMLFVK